MSFGPIILFDKSLIHSLSVDEAVWLQAFFQANIAPVFFVETLADLEKEVAVGRTPEQVVGNLAYKTPVLGANPNVSHLSLCLADLLGHAVEMRRVPVIGGGIPVKVGERSGQVFQSAEMAAMSRWQEGDFLSVERDFAKQYRAALSSLDLRKAREVLADNNLVPRSADLATAKEWADEIVSGAAAKFAALRAAVAMNGVPVAYHRDIVDRWKELGEPPLKQFAPYAAHVFTVDLFFYAGLMSGQISADRPSNRIDMAYLYYLPFCMVFTSFDRLHARTAPYFLSHDQAYVPGQDLKADFSKLDAFYSGLPEDIKAQGVFKFARKPPSGQYVTSDLWDKFLPGWRERDTADVKAPEIANEKLIEYVRSFVQAAEDRSTRPSPLLPNPDNVVIRRKVRPQIGKWRILPPGIDA